MSVPALWLLGYVLQDIDQARGPDRKQMLQTQSPSALVQKTDDLGQELSDQRQQADDRKGQRETLKACIEGSQQTMTSDTVGRLPRGLRDPLSHLSVPDPSRANQVR